MLLLLDEAKDARGNELAQALIGEAQTRGDVSWWAVANDPLIFDYAETSIEATAFAVQALVKRDPNNPLIERAVRWMMLNRTAGYWSSTKQTAMAIYGLLAFMQARGEMAQPFSVDVFVNGAARRPPCVHGGGDDRADPIVISAPANAGANQVRLVKRDGGTRVLVGGGGLLRHGQRRCAHRLAPARDHAQVRAAHAGDASKDRIVYRETPFTGTATAR